MPSNRVRTRESAPKPSGRQAPRTQTEWGALMRTAVAKAEQTKNPLLAGLRTAQAQGKTEAYLRRMGILTPTDIERELG